MATLYKYTGFEDQDLSCSNCGWNGKGKDAVIVDLFGVSKNQEVHCPNCDHYIAELQVPVKNDVPPDELGFEIG